MSGFDDVVIGWKGEEYRVPPNKCMSLLAQIEQVLCPDGGAQDLMNKLSMPQTVHLTTMARTYAVALRYAGAQVTDEDVYLSLAGDVMKGGSDGYMGILTLSQGLMHMFFPDWAVDEDLAQGAEDEGKAPGETDDAPLSQKASSEPSMKSPSEADTSAPSTSGT